MKEANSSGEILSSTFFRKNFITHLRSLPSQKMLFSSITVLMQSADMYPRSPKSMCLNKLIGSIPSLFILSLIRIKLQCISAVRCRTYKINLFVSRLNGFYIIKLITGTLCSGLPSIASLSCFERGLKKMQNSWKRSLFFSLA